MKRSDLARSVQVRFGRMSESDAGVILDRLTQSIVDTVANGDRIEIRGFGRFMPRARAPRDTVNPRTGGRMLISAGRTILFRPSVELIKEMNS